MKRILLFSIFAFIFSSCAPVLMKNITKQLPPLDDSVEVTIYEMGDTVPEHSEVLGGLCTSSARPADGEAVLEKAKKVARAAGGNALEVQSRIYPGQDGRGGTMISAFILNVDDNIKPTQPKAFKKEDFNDYVIQKEGDTIPCLIVFESASHLQFIYGYERRGNRKTISMPKSDLLSYHIENPAVIEEYRQKNRLFKMIVSLDGGYSMSVGHGNSDGNSSSHLSKGFTGFGDVRFNTNNGATLGLHYGYYNLEGTTHFSGHNYSNSGHTEDCHQQLHFIAGSFGLNTPIISKRQRLNCLLDGGCEIQPSMIKHWLYYYLLFGYLSYHEEESYLDNTCILSGGTLGAGGYCGYDYLITEHLSLGIGYGMIMGIPFTATGLNADNLPITRKITTIQMEVFAGIHYYF
jgi:hypothetical protein